MIFKGGTSLSKVFHAIERFSEDVDLSFDRHGLGFTGANDPPAQTGKPRVRTLKLLQKACQKAIREALFPQLSSSFSEALNEVPGKKWNMELAADDPDLQTILFRYPSGFSNSLGERPAYIAPTVRLEFGARSDHWPAVEGAITPYVAEVHPQFFKVSTVTVHTLAPERTFWEKATILHMWHHAPPTKHLGDRQSRHFYDLVQLYEKDVGKIALKNIQLLHAVAAHKQVFFAAAWAKYEDAKPGTLRLVPPTSRRAELQRDYNQMKEMIFGAPPEFDHLLSVLENIERMING